MFKQSRSLKIVVVPVFILILLFFLSFSYQNPHKNTGAKYVFLFIGDGMGLAQTSAAEAYLSAKKGIIGFEKINLSTFPVLSYCTTYSQDNFYTCSASSGTALATGHKTKNGTVSMDSTHTIKYKTIAEMAKDAGMKVGIITSVSIDHATPAVFYAHQASRDDYHDIAIDLVNSNFDFFGGGGFREPDGDINGDTTNIFTLAKKNGYLITNTKTDFEKLNPSAGKVIAINQRLMQGSAILYTIDQNEEDITLAQFTSKAIELLDNEKGFFMMVEGGEIDWLCHANDGASTVHEVIAFDDAVGAAVRFYRQHPEETLIIVVADHETGGMSMGTVNTNEELAFTTLQEQKISMEAFTDIISQYRAEHPGTKADFKEILDIIREYFGLGNDNLMLSDYEKKQLSNAFVLSMKPPSARSTDEQTKLLYDVYEPLAITASKILASKSGIGWTTFSHTAIPVPVRALGKGQELFSGARDNTDIAKEIIEAATF